MKKRFKSLNPAATSSLAYTICTIVQKSISFLTLPLFTRLLTQEQFGQYSIYTTWSAIFTIILTLNLAAGSFDRAMIKFEDEQEKYVSNLQIIVLAISALFLAVYLPLSSFFNDFMSLPTPMVLLMVGEIIGTFAVQTWSAKEKFSYRWKGVVVLTILISLASPFVALAFVLNTTERGYARILGYAIVNIAVGVALLVVNLVKGKNVFTKKFWKYAFGFNLTLLPYYFSQVIFNQSDKIMIEKMIGMREAGIYGLAYQIAIILSFVLTAINSGYLPWLYRAIKNKKYGANTKVTLGITLIFGSLICGLIWLAPEAIEILGGPEYAEAVYVIPPVALSLILLLFSQFSINIEFFYEQKWLLLIGSIAAAGLNIGLNFWLIPIFGYLAAGYTTLASYFVFAAFNYLCILPKVKKTGELRGMFNVWILLGLFFAFAGLSYVGVALYPYRWVRIGIAAGIILAFGVIAFVLRDKIRALLARRKAIPETAEEAKPENTSEDNNEQSM